MRLYSHVMNQIRFGYMVINFQFCKLQWCRKQIESCGGGGARVIRNLEKQTIKKVYGMVTFGYIYVLLFQKSEGGALTP